MSKLIRGEMLPYDFIEQNGLHELCDWLQSIAKARYDMCHSKTNCNKCALKSVGCDLNRADCAVDDLLKAVYEWREDRGELHLIKGIRDVKPVVRGEWELIDEAEPRRYGCTRCRWLSYYEYNFCPHCGADMREEEKDED